MMTGDKSNTARRAFASEMKAMKQLSRVPHRNIVQLLGQVTQNDPILMVMEHVSNGNLRDFLHDARKGAVNRQPLSLDQMNVIMLDIARGMEYLSMKRVIHR
jgi:serine/threonine protein kinase